MAGNGPVPPARSCHLPDIRIEPLQRKLTARELGRRPRRYALPDVRWNVEVAVGGSAHEEQCIRLEHVWRLHLEGLLVRLHVAEAAFLGRDGELGLRERRYAQEIRDLPDHTRK